MKTIKFNKTTHFTGRNGYFKCSGVELETLNRGIGQSVIISPVTSKGVCGRCDIEIPRESIPALIKELESFIEKP